MRPVTIDEILAYIQRELADGDSLEVYRGEPDFSGHRFIEIRIGVWGVPPSYLSGDSPIVQE